MVKWITSTKERYLLVVLFVLAGHGVQSDDTFSNYSSSANYSSLSIGSNAGSMQGVYNFANGFLNAVIHEDINIEELVEITDNSISVQPSNLQVWLKQFQGALALVVIAMILLVAMPLTGFIFCCCYCCCGRCGGKVLPRHDVEEGTTCKLVLSVLLACLAVLLCFSMVGLFGSNQQFKGGMDDFVDHVQLGVNDTSLFLGDTLDQITFLLTDNLGEFLEGINLYLNTTSSQAVGLCDEMQTKIDDQLTDFQGKINTSMNLIKQNLTNIGVKAQQLRNAVDTEIIIIKSKSPSQSVLDQLEKIEKTALIQDPSQIKFGDKIIAMENSFKDLQGNIKVTFDESKKDIPDKIDTAQDNIESAKKTVKENLDKISDQINDTKNQIHKSTDSFLSKSDDFVETTTPYIFGSGVAISCVLLFILLCLLAGLAFGFFGNYYEMNEQRCCGKITGSRFLICSSMTMFFFAIVLALLSVGGFLAVTVVTRSVCYPMQHPNNSKIIDFLDKSMDLSNYNLNVTLGSLLFSCENNYSAYMAFGLESSFDMELIHKNFEDIQATIDKVNLDNTIDVERINSDLETLGKTVDFSNVIDLSLNTTPISLLMQISSTVGLPNKKIPVLTNQISNLLTNVKMEVKLINATLVAAKKFDVDGFKTDFENNANIILKEFKNNMKVLLKSYSQRIDNSILTEIGSCAPIHDVIGGVLISLCDNISTPLNGIWFSAFFFLIISVPVVIIAIILSSKYRKFKMVSYDSPYSIERHNYGFNYSSPLATYENPYNYTPYKSEQIYTELKPEQNYTQYKPEQNYAQYKPEQNYTQYKPEQNYTQYKPEQKSRY